MVARDYVGHDASNWKSDDTLLISFSECHGQQEALLLMPAYGFVRTELGTFFLEPFALRPWTARFRMETGFGDTSCVTQKAPSNYYWRKRPSPFGRGAQVCPFARKYVELS